MRSADPAGAAQPLWDIARPERPSVVPGVSMAGFRSRTAGPVDLEVVAYPAVTLVIDLGEGLLVVDESKDLHWRGSIVAGMEPGRLRGMGRDVECLQVRLTPVAAHAVLGHAPELSGDVVALDDLWGRDGLRTEERLRAATSWRERFALAEEALARRCEQGHAVNAEIDFAWRQMTSSRGSIRVDGLAAELGWSRKRLWSRFRSQIGLTPKRAAQLVRFDHAAHRLAAGHSPADVAAEGGYADQSHLHRDVVAFAGTTPSAVATAAWLSVDDVAWPTSAHAVRP